MEPFTNSPYYLFVQDVATVAISIGFLVVAWKGLATWKAQAKGIKAYEIAYNLHYAILKLRNAISCVRYPATYPSESYKAIQYASNRYPDKQREEIEKNSQAYVYELRWEKIVSATTEIESHLLGAEVLWGSEILDMMKPVNRKVTELNIALHENFQPRDLRTKDPMEIFNMIYERGDDAFSKDVNTAIQDVLNYIKNKLR